MDPPNSQGDWRGGKELPPQSLPVGGFNPLEKY